MLPRDRQVFHEQTLANGIKTAVYADESRYSQVVITIPVGSAHSCAEYIPGTFHFLEHVLYNRSRKYPHLNQYRRLVGMKGATFSASTSPFYTRYVLEAPTIHFDELWEGLFSAIFEPHFVEADLEVERGTITSERKRKERWFPGGSELEQYMSTEWLSDVPLSLRQRLGSDGDLAMITGSALQKAHSDTYFCPGIQMLAGGSANFQPFITQLATLTIAGKAPVKEFSELNWVHKEYHVHPFRDVSRYVLRYGGIISAPPDPVRNRARAFILEYLTNSVHGALFNWLREERGWLYDLGYSSSTALSGQGLWTLRLPLANQEQVEAVRKELPSRIEAALGNEAALRDEVGRLKSRASAYWYPTIGAIITDALASLEVYGYIITEQEYFARYDLFSESALLLDVWSEASRADKAGSFCAIPLF